MRARSGEEGDVGLPFRKNVGEFLASGEEGIVRAAINEHAHAAEIFLPRERDRVDFGRFSGFRVEEVIGDLRSSERGAVSADSREKLRMSEADMKGGESAHRDPAEAPF